MTTTTNRAIWEKGKMPRASDGRFAPIVLDQTPTHKSCTRCGVVKVLSEFPDDSRNTSTRKKSECRECTGKRRKEYRARTWDREYAATRARELMRQYGLTTEQYAGMLEGQMGCCAICGDDPVDYNSELCVDHNHRTGSVRALLCRRCNAGIGQFLDDPDRLRAAIAYLEHYGE